MAWPRVISVPMGDEYPVDRALGIDIKITLRAINAAVDDGENWILRRKAQDSLPGSGAKHSFLGLGAWNFGTS